MCNSVTGRRYNTDSVVTMPEGLDIHHVLNAVTTAEIACKERGKHVAVAESLGIAAAIAEEGIDSFADAGSVELVEN